LIAYWSLKDQIASKHCLSDPGGQWFRIIFPMFRSAKCFAAYTWQVVDRSFEMRDEPRRDDTTQSIHHAARGTLGRLWSQEVIEPRQCVFVGTTNRDTYLRDETGGRRFWPVKAGMINPEALSRDRDQLFAEAVHLYSNGAEWWPKKNFEREHIMPQQTARYEADTWEDNIREFLAAHNPDRVTVGQIAKEALHIETPKIGTADQRRIAAALEQLGWKRQPQSWDGKRWWTKG
jgi:hypothetical protein